jgi:hypothetical protein
VLGKTTEIAARCALLALGAAALFAAPALAVKVVDGPIVLHANICQHWGGHTFSYAVQGEHYMFWTATLNKGIEQESQDGFKKRYPTQLVGQYPLPGTDGVPVVHTFTVDDPDLYYVDEPLLFRTPDGYLHMIVGSYHTTDDPSYWPGTIRYYRSARPEDVTEWVDRTEMLPLAEPYDRFHIRMNVGISPDGERAVIAILAVSKGGAPVPWNTPLVFIGQRDGLDFRFAPPVKYHEPMGFFYPQVAALPGGIVLVGEVWDVAEHATGRLVHLDWEGKILHEEDLPSDPGPGFYASFDMRPAEPGQWDRLVIYHRMAPKEGPWRHQFLTYDLTSRKLEMVREIPVEEGFSNYGKWTYVSPGKSAFLNNPQQGRFWAWEGDILGGGEVQRHPLDYTDVVKLGYLNSGVSLVPNPLTGSIVLPDEVYLLTDASNPGKVPEERGPTSFLMWRIVLDE